MINADKFAENLDKLMTTIVNDHGPIPLGCIYALASAYTLLCRIEEQNKDKDKEQILKLRDNYMKTLEGMLYGDNLIDEL